MTFGWVAGGSRVAQAPLDMSREKDKKEAIYNHFNISHKIPEILPEVCQKCEVYDSIYK